MELQQPSNEPPFTISTADISTKPATTQSKEVLTDKTIISKSAHGPAVDHPTTYGETLMHLLRGNIGSGLFAMGDAFKNGGLILGFILTLYLGIVCVHNQHILLNCSRKVKNKIGADEDPDFAETVELSFEHGAPRLRSWAPASKVIVNTFICLTQLGFCCVYFVFASSSLKQVLDFYGFEFSAYIHMFMVLLPILLPSLILNLKYLAPCSTVANVCMAGGVGVVFYYAFQEIPSPSERKYIGEWSTIPLYFGTAMFAFEGIALVLPLKNAMLKPHSFGMPLGVLNIGISIVTVLYISFGFFGYLKWGDDVKGSLTLNLPQSDVLAQIVKIAVGFGMCLTFALQFFIAIQIMWPFVFKRFGHLCQTTVLELLFRTFMVFVTFIIAAMVPHLNVFISLIGALCSTALALFFPALIQIVLAYGTSEGPTKFVLIKNSLIILFAVFGLTTGTYESINELVKIFVNGE